MTRKIIIASFTALAVLGGAYAACDVEDPDTARAADLTVIVHTDYEFPLRDNPSKRPTSMLVIVDGMSVHGLDEGWIDMGSYGTLNLLAPEEAVQKLLSQGRLPEGQYDQIRFGIDWAAVQVDRKWYPLEIPSEDQSGLKIHTSFCIVSGDPVSLDMELDIDEALHYSDQRGYWLTPSFEVFSPPTCTEDLRTPPLASVPH